MQGAIATFTTTFVYNGDGDRVAKSENRVTTSYVVAVLGLSQVLVETTGGSTTRYVYGHDLLAEYNGTEWTYHLNDGLGSVRQLADATGGVTLAQGYTPFGVPMWSEGNGATGYGFTGERWGAYSALLFLRARYYEPEMGRFTQKDPWEGNYLHPRTLLTNYTYSSNNPTNTTDPSGLYGDDVHVGMTQRDAYALAALLAPSEDPRLLSELIAEGDVHVDRSHALWSTPTATGGCTLCHFCERGRTYRHAHEALMSCNPYLFGAALHQVQDFFSHANEGYTWEHAFDTLRSGGDTGRPQYLIDDFFAGEHCMRGQNGLECWPSPYDAHPRDDVIANLRLRNPSLNLNGLSDNDLINLYLRVDGGHAEERSYFGFHTDRSFPGSAREGEMRRTTAAWIALFMSRISSGSCQCPTSQPIPDDLTIRELLQQ